MKLGNKSGTSRIAPCSTFFMGPRAFQLELKWGGKALDEVFRVTVEKSEEKLKTFIVCNV